MYRTICDCCELPHSSANKLYFQTNDLTYISVETLISNLPDDVFVYVNVEHQIENTFDDERPNELTKLLSPPNQLKRNDSSTVFNQIIESQAEFRGRSFQDQLTKFNRILAHLVNERTVLAWFRMNLAFITLAFKYYKLASINFLQYKYISYLLFLCGGLYMILLPWSLHIGFNRFRQCKNMIDYDITRLGSYLHQMGFDYDNFSLGFVIIFSFLTICISSTFMIWKL